VKFPLNELRKDFAPEIIILGIREGKEGMGSTIVPKKIYCLPPKNKVIVRMIYEFYPFLCSKCKINPKIT